MCYYYAQIDESNICIGVSQLSGEVNLPSMVLLDNYDSSLLGRQYNNGGWEDVEQPEPQEPPISEIEQAILQTAITTEYMVAIMETTI